MMNFWTKTLGYIILAIIIAVTTISIGAGILTFWLSTFYYTAGATIMIVVWLTLIGFILNRGAYRDLCFYCLIVYTLGIIIGYWVF